MDEHHGAFGQDTFGQAAERAARFFGTPRYIIGQTIIVIAWIAVNSVALVAHWDPYPFILLNLAFSTQAAYAAPLILLAETRQAARDKTMGDQLEKHREEVERLYDPRFVRMWEFYLASSEMAFRQQGMMVFQMQLTKRQGIVPMTRDYIIRE